jgi:protein-S-isoprenylcysteine O-methyltransferase Ste14
MPKPFPIIIWPVVAFAVFWAVTWLSVKKTAEKQKTSEWFSYWIFGFIAVMLLFALSYAPVLDTSLIAGSLLSRSLGFLVEVLGLCLAIWARMTLGRNWSSSVAFKERHELITKGPYRLVRHPIYTGMLTMFLGAAIYLGVLAGFLAVLSMFASFLIKSRQEEKMMAKHFPREYARYKRRTKAIIPFVY